jgi:hypothetical protein
MASRPRGSPTSWCVSGSTATGSTIDAVRAVTRLLNTHPFDSPPFQTGGHGLLGSNLVEALLARGETTIRILDMVDLPLFESERARGLVTFIKV